MSENEQVFFREEQSFRQRWIWVPLLLPLLFVSAGLLWLLTRPPGSVPPQLWRSLAATDLVLAAVTLWLYKMRLVTEVRAGYLVLHFQWLWRRRWIPFTDIQSYRVVTYNPVAEYGGWGIRYGAAGDKAYNVSGTRGVRLEFTNGGRLLIGSQRPEELARALDLALRADATPPIRAHEWSGE
jgi:hypothetical protein